MSAAAGLCTAINLTIRSRSARKVSLKITLKSIRSTGREPDEPNLPDPESRRPRRWLHPTPQKVWVTLITLVDSVGAPFFPNERRPRLQREAAQFVCLQRVQFSFNFGITHGACSLAATARERKRVDARLRRRLAASFLMGMRWRRELSWLISHRRIF